MNTLRYYFPGLLLILIAIMIIAVPEILVVLVAGVFILAGIGALYVGHAMRKSAITWGQSEDRPESGQFHGWRFERIPIFRSWRRYF